VIETAAQFVVVALTALAGVPALRRMVAAAAGLTPCAAAALWPTSYRLAAAGPTGSAAGNRGRVSAYRRAPPGVRRRGKDGTAAGLPAGAVR